MTATEAEQADALVLPLVRSPDGRRARFNTQERPHAHEGSPVPADPQPERKPRELRLRMPMPSARTVSGILQGGSLLTAAPSAVLTIWAGHKQAAEYYRRYRLLTRWPRLVYGAGHAFIEVPFLYLWAWSGHSPFLRAVVLATILVILRLLGVHIVWSWL